MDEQTIAQYRKIQEQNAKQQAQMMKEMDIDPNDFGYDDPELADLERQLKKQAKGGNTELDDDEALMAELDGYGSEDADDLLEEPAFDPKQKEEELVQAIKVEKSKAVAARDAGDKQTAMVHLKQSKQIDAELKELREKYPSLSQPQSKQPAQQVQRQQQQQDSGAGSLTGKEDMIELEDKFHDPDEMISMTVIEHEVKYLAVLVQRYKNQPDEKQFFESKIESLNFSKESIMTNIQTGITTPESYITGIKKWKIKVNSYYQQSLKVFGDKNEHTQRLMKRLKLVNDEIAEFEQSMQEQQEEEVKATQNTQQQTEKPKAAPQKTNTMDDEKKQMIVQLLKDRCEDLTHACQYNMKELQNKEQAATLLNQAEYAKTLIEKLKIGGDIAKEDLAKCPAVTPEHVFGYSEQQRSAKIDEAYAILGKEQSEMIAHIKQISGMKSKAQNKKQLQQYDAEIQDLMKKAKDKKAELQKIAALKQNKNQPPPIVGAIETQIQKEKVNEDLKPNQVKVLIVNSDGLKKSGGTYLSYKVFFEDGVKSKSKMQLDKGENVMIFNLSALNQLRNVNGAEFTFKLKKKKIIGKKQLDASEVKISGFIHKSEVSRKVSINGAQFQVTVTIHKALKGQEFETVTETSTGIKGIPAAYQPIKRAPSKPAPQKQVQPQQQKQVAPQATKQGQQQRAQQPQAAQAQQASTGSGSVQIPAGVTAEDIKNPQNLSNMNCMSLLEKKVPEFKAAIDKAIANGERPSPSVRSQWMECNKRMMQIQTACGNGTMTPEQYIEIQNAQVVKDKAMLQYFKQTGDNAKAAIVSQRLQIILGELKDMQ